MDQKYDLVIPSRIMFPDTLWNTLKLEAWKKNITVSTLICEILKEYLEQNPNMNLILEKYMVAFKEDISCRRHQIKFNPEALKLIGGVSINHKENRDTIICSICYGYMQLKE